MRSIVLIILCCVPYIGIWAQSDTLPYTMYKDQLIVYGDLGFRASPFSISGDMAGEVDKIEFKHNLKTILGIGVAYRWFALRIGFGLPGNLRAVSRYGEANYADLGVRFNVKKTFWDIDFRINNGYAVKDAYTWNDTLNELHPNDIRSQVRTAGFSVNSWYFLSKQFKMQPVLGITGDFKKSTGTVYLKNTLNFFGVSADYGSIIPRELTDSLNTKTEAGVISAVDMGIVPGYAYVFRKNYWQASIFGGLGGVIQSKFYTVGGETRSFLGLSPRIDFRFIAGYSKPKVFVWLVTDFDFKSITFDVNTYKYNQNYYNVAILVGYRFATKKSKSSDQGGLR